jgi:hypothetical protein
MGWANDRILGVVGLSFFLSLFSTWAQVTLDALS